MAVLNDYWHLVLADLKNNLNRSVYETWLSQLEFLKTENSGRKVVLSVPSRFNQKYLETKFSTQLLEAVRKYFPRVIHLEFRISQKKNLSDIQIQDSFFESEEAKSSSKMKYKETSKIDSRDFNLQLKPTTLFNDSLNNLNPKYTLESFVQTSSNLLACNVAKAIVEKPGQRYNPVFLYSGVGLGKTHLLQAIGQKILENQPNLKIKYATSEMFFNHFIASIQNKSGKAFHEYYRSCDVLLIDDIQFISGKEATQEAFFHAFNELHQNNKQIVITSDKPPKSIASIEERLVSRFEWGLVIDIGFPDFEDRLSVLNFKLDKLNFNLNEQQKVKIATAVDTNFRDLEGVLNRIEARIKLLPDRPFEDYELAKILAGFKKASTIHFQISNKLNNPQDLIELVCSVFGVSKEEIYSTSRQQNLALARQVAMYCCREFLNLSFPATAKLFNRDHTTVMHAWKKISKQSLDTKNTYLYNKLQEIRSNPFLLTK